MDRSRLQETLASLYLRLNGYVTSGLIIHSEDSGNVSSELDIIGVRFQNHAQDDRQVPSSDYLKIPKESFIDIIICEVKGGSRKNSLQFNQSIRESKSVRLKLLKWIGAFQNKQIEDLEKKLEYAIANREKNNSDSFQEIITTPENIKVTLRPIIFAPDRPLPRANQIRYIPGEEMLNYCWLCFRPSRIRDTCATDYYSINNWGGQYEQIVRYFKNPEKQNAGSMEDFYNFFN